MITKINLDKVASFKSLSYLETDKKVNLIYGLNGTGKSTCSNFLYNQNESKYSNCSIVGGDEDEILVYNQKFIQDYFFVEENLKGIFTLSKENKEAKEKISAAQKEVDRFTAEKKAKEDELKKLNREIEGQVSSAQDKTWVIKSNYTGGDRVLEFCLEGLKGNKGKLFEHIIAISKPTIKPDKDIEKIKEEVQTLVGDSATSYAPIDTFDWIQHKNESNDILKKVIVGNENSSVASLIGKLNNSDWVKDGLKFLLSEPSNEVSQCPFCQEQTITESLISNIKEYFNEAYENDLQELNKILTEYETGLYAVTEKSVLISHPIFGADKTDIESKHDKFCTQVRSNISLIKEKIKTPSKPISLTDTKNLFENLILCINQANEKIEEHNKKVENKEKTFKELYDSFWNLMRWEYDQTIEAYNSANSEYIKQKKIHENTITELETKATDQNKLIIDEQKKTVNIDEAIDNINSGLIELGIDEFSIKKHTDILYKIVRDQTDNEVFQTLSEGEKMIISFLYFIELCRGKKGTTDSNKNKVIVIDDPISSLSHIYVFNIGRLIKNEFLGKKQTKDGQTTWKYKYEQFFLLTHSLYFFYEITETKHDERKETQNLYRLTKNEQGSKFVPMSYEEIQNDYQSYWQVVKDENQNPALIANCMRNIVEYFFNFIEKRDLSNVTQKPELKDTRYQAFFRYVNRESHSLGQNIFDLKEFNYTDFKDALKLLFETTGYGEHYKRMTK